MRCLALLDFYLLILGVFLTTAQQKSVTIYGPSIAKSLFEDLSTTFTLAEEDSHYGMQYNTTTHEQVNSLLSAGRAVVVDTLQDIPSNATSLPLFGFPLVIVFNLNISKLSLSQQTLVDIFSGRITHWNDTNLTFHNPGTVFPDEPITLVVGPLLDRFAEAMSVLAGKPVNLTSIDAIASDNRVGARVKATPFSLGFSWMADAVATNAKLASLQNKDGYFVNPDQGAASALSEFHAESDQALEDGFGATPDRIGRLKTVSPHNKGGRLSWPLMGMLYVVVPETVACDELQILQRFLSVILFQTENMRLLVALLGWQPANSLYVLDELLGKLPAEVGVREILWGKSCETNLHEDVLVGASSELGLTMLKMLVPYAGKNSLLQLATHTSNVTDLLASMLSEEGRSIDVDLVLTWEPMLASYPQLLSVPVFMGSLAPLVNVGPLSPILSLPVIADIFMRVITYWNDSRIAELNPGMQLPSETITVLASNLNGPTVFFAQLLSQYSPSFSWSRVQQTVEQGSNLVDLVSFTPFSIGYGFGQLVEFGDQVPRIIGFGHTPVNFSADALAACWISKTHPDCWPLAIPLTFALRNPGEGGASCAHRKYSVDFVSWISSRSTGLDQFLVPNPFNNSLGDAEFCNGRSLLVSKSESITFSQPLKTAVWTLSGIAVAWALSQGIALGVARKRSELKAASVVFSVLANIGVYLILWSPFLLIRDNPTPSLCGLSIWSLTLGFSLCYGSLFAKILRLYIIFTSRKLVVPRLSNRKLLRVMAGFLILDFVLLLAYSIDTPPRSANFSAFVRDDQDLVTGFSEQTLNMCSFDGRSWPLRIIVVVKILVVLGGAVMAFFIRQVDRRFSATSALGLAFYNMFLTSAIVTVVLLLFKGQDELVSPLATSVFSGLWIMYITLVALSLDSNILLACKDFSKPLRMMLNGTKRARSSTKNPELKKVSDESSETKVSHSSTIFVVNREMFPSKYDDFENALLEQVLEELNFQRAAVRRVLAANSTGNTTTCIELTDLERHRGSTKLDTPRAKAQPTASVRVGTTQSDLSNKSQSQSSQISHSPNPSQISSDPLEAKPVAFPISISSDRKPSDLSRPAAISHLESGPLDFSLEQKIHRN